MHEPSVSSRAAVEADQLDRLRALVRSLLASNDFYRPRLQAAGLTDRNAITLEVFRRLPFTHKRELVDDQQIHTPFGSNLTEPLDSYTRFHQTSGTTGFPMRWLDTPESWSHLLDNWQRVYEAAGVTPADRVFFAFSFGPFLGFWTAHDAAARMDCLCIPGGGLSSAARLRLIFDNAATVLCCTPTYAMRLAEVADELDMDLAESNIRRIIVAGEPGGSLPATRDRIEASWLGATVVDHHGMTEVGPVTYEHPNRRAALAVIESAFIAEFIDPQTGEIVSAADVDNSGAELVLTTLGRTASPLLRYRTGDIVKPIFVNDTGEPDADGQLCFEGGILARADDMLIVRGVNVFPSAIDQIVRTDSRVVEYRVTVDEADAMANLSIEIESDAPGVAASLEAALRDSLSLRIPVTAVDLGSLPRFEMKAKRWIKREAN